MPIKRANCNDKSKVQLLIFLVLRFEFFKCFFIVTLVPGTNPHMKIAVTVLAGVTCRLTHRQVICIIKLIDVLRIMTFHTDFSFVANFISFLDIHLYISRASRWIIVKMVIIKLLRVTFFVKLPADSTLLITPGWFICNENRVNNRGIILITLFI